MEPRARAGCHRSSSFLSSFLSLKPPRAKKKPPPPRSPPPPPPTPEEVFAAAAALVAFEEFPARVAFAE